MKPIVLAPQSVLSEPAKPVVFFDEKLQKLLKDMRETLLATVNPRGVGLAAPQIGVGQAVFITKPTEKTKIRAFINPEIIKKSEQVSDSKKDNGKLEGCLSIPKLWGSVKRAKTVTLRYQDEKGISHEEEFTGFMAIIIQHETDHLSGILFAQRVLEQKGMFYQTATNEKGEEILEEMSI